MTTEEADGLIGQTGRVHVAGRGQRPTVYKVVGYDLDPDDDGGGVKTLRLESVEQTPARVDYDGRDHHLPTSERRIVRTIDPIPLVVMPRCPAKWFRPIVDTPAAPVKRPT
jgi:hypothetical protein